MDKILDVNGEIEKETLDSVYLEKLDKLGVDIVFCR
jgi:hypothetical protein